MRQVRQLQLSQMMLALLFLYCWVAPTASQAQPSPISSSDPFVQLDAEKTPRFSDLLDTLSTQANITFIVEGSPFTPALSAEQVKKVSASKVRLSEMVEQVAEAFDYEVTQPSNNLFRMEKRYSDSNDLPGVTLQECRLATRDMLRLLSAWNPKLKAHCPEDPRVKEFIASLTEEQLQAMAIRSQGLPVSSLSLRQQSQVWQIALHFYVQLPEQDIRAVAAQIDCVLNKNTTFGWSDQRGMRLFGYEGRLRLSDGQPFVYFRPLSHPGRVMSRADGVVGFITSKAPSNQPKQFLPRDAYHDPTQPGVADTKPGDAKQHVGTTLGEVVSELNARANGSLSMVVDEALASKPITAIGLEYATPAAILQAAADIYGLRVKKESDGALRLTRMFWRTPRNIAELPESLRRMFPKPLLRALHIDEIDRVWAQERKERHRRAAQKVAPQNSEDSPSATDKAEEAGKTVELIKKRLELKASPTILRIAAVRRLRTGVEPKLETTSNGRVPLTALGEPERTALANVIMADCFQAVNLILSKEPPDYITSFSTTILTGGVGKDPAGKLKFALFLKQPPLPDGTVFFRSAGFSNVDYEQ